MENINKNKLAFIFLVLFVVFGAIYISQIKPAVQGDGREYILQTVAFQNHLSFGVTVDDLISYDKEESLGLGVPPKGKHVFGMVKVGDKGQIVIPAKARKIFDIKPGDNLLVLGDEGQGIAIMKEQGLLDMLKAIRN